MLFILESKSESLLFTTNGLLSLLENDLPWEVIGPVSLGIESGDTHGGVRPEALAQS